MKVTFKTDDPKEILRLAKSLDMALALFEIQNNVWRQFKHGDEKIDFQEYREAVQEMFEEYNINLDELLD